MKTEKLEYLVETARHWAKTLHEGQKYGEEDYFSGHIEKVVETTVDLITNGQGKHLSKTESYLALVVAYLHDIVEDTKVTSEDVRETFGSIVAQEVIYLTKTSNMTSEQQWAAAKRGTLSKLVKKADMLVNLKKSIASDNSRLISKYLQGLTVLSE